MLTKARTTENDGGEHQPETVCTNELQAFTAEKKRRSNSPYAFNYLLALVSTIVK